MRTSGSRQSVDQRIHAYRQEYPELSHGEAGETRDRSLRYDPRRTRAAARNHGYKRGQRTAIRSRGGRGNLPVPRVSGGANLPSTQET